jgi:hypothetical protein
MLNNKFHSYPIQTFKIQVMKKIKIMFLLVFVSSAFLQAQTWQALGPINRTGQPGEVAGQGSGIITTIAFHPKYNTADPALGGAINKTIFAGSPFGGIWISRDDGANWYTSDPLVPAQYPNLTTDFNFRGAGVVDIVIDPVSPTTIYAAFSSSEQGGGYALMGNYYPCTGIYKYTPSNGWVNTNSYAYQSNFSVYELEMSPTDHLRLFACTTSGVISTVDGLHWGIPLVTEGPDKPFRNMLFDPTNSSIAFASGREVYKSTDGGTSYSAISNFTPMLPDIVGGIIQTNIAVISSTAVYARVHYNKNIPNVGVARAECFFRYNGSTWAPLPIFPSVFEYHYDRMPMTAKKVGSIEYVFAGSELVHRYQYNSSQDGWTAITDYGGNMHADIHDIVLSPGDVTLAVGHDGGISKTASNFYATPTWTTINNGLNISTVISFSGSQKNPNIILTGEHDNGNSIIKNAQAASPSWTGYMMCDGGDKMTSLYDPNEWYDRQQQYGGKPIFRNSDGNEANNYSSTLIFSNSTLLPATSNPYHGQFEEFGDKKLMIMDPNNPNIVYRGTNILVRSMDKGDNSQILFRKSDCYETSNYDLHSHINSMAIAPSNSNYMYINFINPYSFEPQFTNHIYKTTNALTGTYAAPCIHTTASEGVVCGNWSDITPNFGFSNKKSVINSIVVSDKDPNVIWAGFSYNPDITPAANRKNYLVWKYDGTSWADWSLGLPDNISITSLVYEKGSNDGIYAGTDVGGVFYRNKSMTGGWIHYAVGMPNALVNQLEINNTENTVRAGTYGRGIWKNTLYCPTAPYTNNPNPCNECNSSTNNFWEGTNVTIQNTTLTVNKHFVRAVDYIDVLPNTTLTSSATAYYDLYIHGCGPSQKNSYRKIDGVDIGDKDLVIDFGENEEEEVEEAAIAVYPNPNNGTFTLNAGNSEEKDIYIYNALGEIVYQKNNTSERTVDINITNVPKGIYLVKVVLDDKTKTIKIINQ